MKKSNWYRACAGAIALAATCTYTLPNAEAAVVFSDNFDRGDSATIGTPTGAGSGQWTPLIGPLLATPPSGSVEVSNEQLVVNHGLNPSFYQVSYPVADFAEPWGNTLASNTNKVVWEFNMHSSRPSLGDPPIFPGTEVANYVSVVLAATSNNPLDNQGYAVSWGDVDSDRLRLVRFTTQGGNLNASTFISGVNAGAPFNNMGTEFLSVRVEFDPSNSEWSFYARNDGAQFDDPKSVVPYVLLGQRIEELDDTFINLPISHVGFAGIYSGNDTNVYTYDNFTISVVPEPSAFLLGSVGLIGIAAVRRRFGKKVA